MAGENLVRPKGFKAKIENFWYHYKYHTIAFIAVVVTLSITLAQCATKTNYDYKIVVATRSVTLATGQLQAITAEISEYGEDLNGDGEVNVLLVDCTLDGNTSDYQNLLAKQQKLQALLMTDTDAMLFVTDEKCMEWIDNLNPETKFIADTGLPHNNGRGFIISNTHIIQDAKKSVDPKGKMIWPTDLSISRRRVEGTAFEEKEGAEESAKKADEFIERIIKKNSK